MNARKIRKFYKEYRWYNEANVLRDVEANLFHLERDVVLNDISNQSKDLILAEIKSLNNIKTKILKEFPEYDI